MCVSTAQRMLTLSSRSLFMRTTPNHHPLQTKYLFRDYDQDINVRYDAVTALKKAKQPSTYCKDVYFKTLQTVCKFSITLFFSLQKENYVCRNRSLNYLKTRDAIYVELLIRTCASKHSTWSFDHSCFHSYVYEYRMDQHFSVLSTYYPKPSKSITTATGFNLNASRCSVDLVFVGRKQT